MELLTAHINYKGIRLLSLLTSLLTVVGICQAQSVKFRFVEASPQEVILEVQDKTDLQFNYLAASLPQQRYTFSTSAEGTALVEVLSEVFDRALILLDEQSVTITAAPREEEYTQQQSITNTIYDTNTGLPVIGAAIYLPNLSVGTTTDVDGVFNLEGYFAAEEQAVIRYLGYESISTTVGRLGSSQRIAISGKEHVLDDIVIRSAKHIARSNTTSDYIDPSELTPPGSPDGDAIALAQLVPGVYNSSESFNDLQIRGGPPDQVSFNWNGIRLFQNSLFYGRISAVNPLMVDQVQITRNGASSDEDAAASGAIHMDGDLSQVDSTAMHLHVNALYVNTAIETALLDDKLKVKAAYRRSLTDVVQTPIYDRYFDNSFQFGRIPELLYFIDSFDLAEFKDLQPTFMFSDLSTSVQYDISDKTRLTAHGLRYGNTFTQRIFDQFVDGAEVDSFTLRTTGGAIEWQQKYGQNLRSEISASGSLYEYYYYNTDNTLNPDADELYIGSTLRQRAVKAKLVYEQPTYDIEAGYDHYFWEAEYDAFSTRSYESYLIDYNQTTAHEGSYFLTGSFYSASWYKLMAGIRVSDYSRALLNRGFAEPRLHLSIFASPKLTVHAHYGKFHQSLNRQRFNTNLQVDNGFWWLSDETEDASRFFFVVQSAQASTGVRYTTGSWQLTADVYRKSASQVYSTAFDFTPEEDPFEYSDVRVNGLELSATYSNRWLTLLATYDYIDDTVYPDSEEGGFTSPFSQPHRFSLFQSLRYGKWSLSSQFVAATGRAFSVPVDLQEFDDKGDIYYLLIFDDYFTERSPTYMKLDAGLSYQLYDTGRRSGKVSFQFINILNRGNIIRDQYFISYRQVEPVTQRFQRQGLPFLWNVAVDFTF